MKKSTEYLIAAVFIALYVLAFIIAYLLYKDDPEALTMSLCAISMGAMPFTMVLGVIIIESSKKDEIREYDRKRREMEGKEQP